MSLRDKAAKINFDNLDEPTPVGVTTASPAAAPGPAPAAGSKPRTGVAAITERINIHHRVVELEAQVATLSAADVVVQLDPKLVRQSKWKNRHELSFSTQEYADLKSEIEAAGGNVQPIKVRRAQKGDGEQEYEVVYGRRRLRACLDLGLLVNAIIEDMDDLQLFTEMDRENRNRADLSPWEQGVMYKDAIEAKLFPSQRQMAAALNISTGNMSMAVALASLPQEVIQAFPSPLELQHRWAADLTRVLEEDAAKVMAVAAEISALTPRPSAKEVFARLVSKGSTDSLVKKDLKVRGKVVGSIARDAKGAMSLKFHAGTLTEGNEKKLLEFVDKLLA